MSQPYFVPEFQIEIENRRIPAALRASISGVSHQAGLEGSDRVELTVVNENLRWLDHPLLTIDNTLKLNLGYLPDSLEQVFVGQIVGQSASFPGSGAPTLTVNAQDRMQRLQEGDKVRWFAIPVPTIGNFPLPDPLTADIVAVENGLIPINDPIGAALAVLLGGVEAVAAIGDPDAMQKVIRKQDGESDFDFLSTIARHNGWEMFIEHQGPLGGHQLRFMSPLDKLSPELEFEYGRNLIEFTPRLSSVGQLVSVSAYVWIAPLKTNFTVTVGWDFDRMALTLDVRPELIPLGQGPSSHLIEDPVTPVSAPREIISELIPRLNNRLTGSGSVVGDARLRPGMVIRLAGLGVEFGGLYRVTSVTHSLDGSGWRTTFEARKEIWFGSIPAPDQGAVPVRIQGQTI